MRAKTGMGIGAELGTGQSRDKDRDGYKDRQTGTCKEIQRSPSHPVFLHSGPDRVNYKLIASQYSVVVLIASRAPYCIA